MQEVGLWGCSPAAKAILEGSYCCLPNMDEYTQQFSEALQWPHSKMDLISTILNLEAFCSGMGIHLFFILGVHFGHYKAALFSKELAHLHARWIMMGISLSCYQSGLQVILEKSL